MLQRCSHITSVYATLTWHGWTLSFLVPNACKTEQKCYTTHMCFSKKNTWIYHSLFSTVFGGFFNTHASVLFGLPVLWRWARPPRPWLQAYLWGRRGGLGAESALTAPPHRLRERVASAAHDDLVRWLGEGLRLWSAGDGADRCDDTVSFGFACGRENCFRPLAIPQSVGVFACRPYRPCLFQEEPFHL